MVAIITDVYYKMALAIIRDLGERGIKVIACQSEHIREKNKKIKALGFYSKYVYQQEWLEDVNKEPEKYINSLLILCNKVSEENNEQCVVIPVGAKTLQLLSEPQNRKRFSHIGLLIPTKEQLDLYNGKKEVAELADRLGVPVPKEYSISDSIFNQMLEDIELPVVVKPNCGEKLNLKAEQRYFIVRDREKLREKILHFHKLEGQYPVVQEFIDGDGFGLSVLAYKGKVVDLVGHHRLREYPYTGGPSTCCAYKECSELIDYAKKMVQAVEYTGIAMFEFKEAKDGTFRLLEINPRVWGTFPMTRVAKTNFSYNWYALSYNEVNTKQLPIYPYSVDYEKKTEVVKGNAGYFNRKKNTIMRYYFADIRASIGYIKHHQIKRGLKGLLQIFRPGIKDGVVELRDFSASFHYIKSLFR